MDHKDQQIKLFQALGFNSLEENSQVSLTLLLKTIFIPQCKKEVHGSPPKLPIICFAEAPGDSLGECGFSSPDLGCRTCTGCLGLSIPFLKAKTTEDPARKLKDRKLSEMKQKLLSTTAEGRQCPVGTDGKCCDSFTLKMPREAFWKEISLR